MSEFNLLEIVREDPYIRSFIGKIVKNFDLSDECRKAMIIIRDDLFAMMNDWHGKGEMLPSEWLKFLCHEIDGDNTIFPEAYGEISKEDFHIEMRRALIKNQPIRAVWAFMFSCFRFFEMDFQYKRYLHKMIGTITHLIEE